MTYQDEIDHLKLRIRCVKKILKAIKNKEPVEFSEIEKYVKDRTGFLQTYRHLFMPLE